MIWFAIASLTPALLLGLACLLGGMWSLAAVVSITVLAFGMDRLVTRLMPDTVEGDGLGLSLGLAGVHFALWGLGVWAIGSGHVRGLDAVLCLVGLGLYFGQISNSNAHELIHNARRLPRRVGIAIYCSILFGHHASAHMRVHHVHAATQRDPNTARYGEGYWRYLLRAWRGSFVAGKRAEDDLRARADTPAPVWTHPYVWYAIGNLVAVLSAAVLAGFGGVLTLLLIASYAQAQLYLSDYVQHYGLVRGEVEPGRVEAMGKAHSWNAPHWYSGAMMLNAPRHSDHHLNPARPFPSLRLDQSDMPTLPHSLPVMAALALVPPIWRRIMNRRVRQWRDRANV